MTQTPPPPGGDPRGWQGHNNPYAVDDALAQWAKARGYALSATPDIAWYKAWYPCAYMPPVARVGRELRATFDEAKLAVIEAFGGDILLQATGEDRNNCFFILSPRLTARAALRSKSGGGIVHDLSSGLDSLFRGGGAPGGVLGDPTFEGRFDVTTPSREEGLRALPMGLRRLLVGASFRGVIETRPGGLVGTMYDRRSFDAASLDAMITQVGQIYSAAVASE